MKAACVLHIVLNQGPGTRRNTATHALIHPHLNPQSALRIASCSPNEQHIQAYVALERVMWRAQAVAQRNPDCGIGAQRGAKHIRGCRHHTASHIGHTSMQPQSDTRGNKHPCQTTHSLSTMLDETQYPATKLDLEKASPSLRMLATPSAWQPRVLHTLAPLATLEHTEPTRTLAHPVAARLWYTLVNHPQHPSLLLESIGHRRFGNMLR